MRKSHEDTLEKKKEQEVAIESVCALEARKKRDIFIAILIIKHCIK